MEAARLVPSKSGEQVKAGSRVDVTKKSILSFMAEHLAKLAVDYYNEMHKQDEDTMAFVKMKEAVVIRRLEQIYFITFEAKFLSKEGRETKRTNCRATILKKLGGDLEVYSSKVGSPDGKDLIELSKKYFNSTVLFSEAKEVLLKEKMEAGSPKPPASVEEIDQLPMEGVQVVPSESKKRKGKTVSPGIGSSDDTLKKVKHGEGRPPLCNKRKVFIVGLVKAEITSNVKKFASIAVAHYNDKLQVGKGQDEAHKD